MVRIYARERAVVRTLTASKGASPHAYWCLRQGVNRMIESTPRVFLLTNLEDKHGFSQCF